MYPWFTMHPALIALLIVIMIWAAIWKAIALWKSARNHQVVWFIVIAVFNTIGLLEIIYLAFFQRNRNEAMPVIIKEKKPVRKKK